MATPNLVNIATITPKNAMGSLSDTNRTTMIDVPAETAVRIDTILLANIDGTSAVDATVEISNDNGSTYFKIASTISCPADATLVVVDKNTALYLEEGDNRKQRKFNPNFYETKIVAGWAATGGGAVINSDLNEALKQTQLSMHLIVTNHSFNFNDNGSVTLKISFIARIDSIMSDVRSDVLFDQETKNE